MHPIPKAFVKEVENRAANVRKDYYFESGVVLASNGKYNKPISNKNDKAIGNCF